MTPLHFVITGAGRGIGLELTRQLLQAGHRVSALARKPSPDLTKLQGAHPDRLHLYPVDVRSDADVERFAKELPEKSVDVLINNAGIMGSYGDRGIGDVSLDEISEVLAVNSVAPIRVTRALIPRLERAKHAKIVNITSLMGSIDDNSSGRAYGYRMSKAALNMFTKGLAIDYPSIVSLAIHPGWVKTDMGGEDAPLETDESARGIIDVTMRATIKDSGSFIGYDGERFPW